MISKVPPPMHLSAGFGSFFLLFSTKLAAASPAQIPFGYALQEEQWDLSVLPSVDATENLVFATVNSFLQHWPNTRYRNGHNLVPGVVPAGTLLYHGRDRNEIPDKPDWAAVDPEHSYLFCRGSSENGCWHLTIVAARPLRVLYFDGSSAAKMTGGPMDSQDIVGWGKIMPDNTMREMKRIVDLCDWGKKFAIDGFVRMEMDFEIMLCDFTAGVDVVSFSNLAARRAPWRRPGKPGKPGEGPPGGPPPPPPHSDPGDASMDADTKVGEDIISGSWHNHYPGDTRIKLDYTRLVSFYDTSLVPSLVAKRLGQDRLHHRLDGIDTKDVSAVMSRLEDVLSQGMGSSVVDWPVLLQVTVDRFSQRLEDLQYYLSNTTSLANLKKAQTILQVMVQAYMLHGLDTTKQSWASPVYKWCATTHTSYIWSVPSMTQSEILLLNAVEKTNKEICRVVVGLWAEGVEAGLDSMITVDPTTSPDPEVLIPKWLSVTESLMKWLDWGVWLKCRPACEYEHICYLPTWPLFRSPHQGPPGAPGESDDWEDPKPRCRRRIDSLLL